MIATPPRGIASFVVAGGLAIALLFAMRGDSPEPADTNAQRALDAWARSCPEALNGLCIAMRPLPPAPPGDQPVRCGPESNARVALVRSPALAAAARLALGDAIQQGGDRSTYVRATIALADNELEQYLAIAFPTGLSFDPADEARKDESLARFGAWVSQKMELGQTLRVRYEAIVALGDPVGTVAATSRLGMIAGGFSDDLFRAAIPEDVRTGEYADEKVEAFCDRMTEVAEPLETLALETYELCALRARKAAPAMGVTELRLLANAAKPCLAELARMKPDDYPLVEEVFTASELARLRIELGVAAPVLEGTDYDRHNTAGVVHRTKRNFAAARASYERAIAIDDKQPAAHYNLGLLSMMESTTTDPAGSIAILEKAVEHFENAAARANGELFGKAVDRSLWAGRVLLDTRVFLAEMAL